MAKLSLNKAARYAGKAKADILSALASQDPSKKLSGEKNDKGHWEIEESELDRLYGKKEAEPVFKPVQLDGENHNSTSGLQVKVEMLEERLAAEQAERERERQNLQDQLAKADERAEQARADYQQSLAILTDQRPKGEAQEKLEAELARLRTEMADMRRPLFSNPFKRKKAG